MMRLVETLWNTPYLYPYIILMKSKILPQNFCTYSFLCPEHNPLYSLYHFIPISNHTTIYQRCCPSPSNLKESPSLSVPWP